MVETKELRITHIKTKILQGKFGNGNYFGYKKNKIISLIKFETNHKIFGYGESIIGIYAPELFKKNVSYLSKFFLNKNLDDAIEEIEQIQQNKFFFYQGLIKSILSSFEIALLSIKSKINKCSLGQTINYTYFHGKEKQSKIIDIYSSAGSIKSSLNDIKKDIKKSKNLGIKKIKIRLDLSKDYKKKINLIEKEMESFAVDLIANTFKKNNNKINLIKFLNYIKNKKILWVEEPVNVNELNFFAKLSKYNKIPFSYGENFNSFIDFSNLLNIRGLNFINIDITHCTISDLKRIINHMSENKIKKKIILHCWGSIINLNASLEIASILKKYIYKVEFPITDFTLNDFFIKTKLIKNSAIYLNNNLEDIETFYENKPRFIISDRNKFKFD